MEFLKIGVVQFLELHRISQHSIPQATLLSEPQLVKQLVDVPVPELVILARGKSALGLDWCQVAAPGRGTGGRRVRATPGGTPQQGLPPAQGGKQMLVPG